MGNVEFWKWCMLNIFIDGVERVKCCLQVWCTMKRWSIEMVNHHFNIASCWILQCVNLRTCSRSQHWVCSRQVHPDCWCMKAHIGFWSTVVYNGNCGRVVIFNTLWCPNVETLSMLKCITWRNVKLLDWRTLQILKGWTPGNVERLKGYNVAVLHRFNFALPGSPWLGVLGKTTARKAQP